MPMAKDSPVQKAMAAAIQEATGVNEGLFGSGVPDFFLWKSNGEYRFVEIKASEGALNDNQLKWAESYDWNFYIAQLAHISEDLSEEQVLERNRIA